ncbi:MAG: host attachment protein [Phycisphaerales bacterium]|nr:host attachment protein [Phycisphaerales bacterium]
MTANFEHPGQAIVLADARQARLFMCLFDERDRLRLSEVDALQNDHEHDSEPRKPERPAGKRADAPVHTPSQGPDEVETRRFVREIGRWVRSTGERHGKVGLLAGPKLLGLLRQEFADSGAPVELWEGDLTGLPEKELQGHPTLARAVRELRRQAAKL